MTRRFTPSILIAIGLILCACTSDDPSTPGLDVKDTGPTSTEIAPIFAVPTNDGGEFSLSEHLATDGRPVFLNLWASWCFPCREEMPAIDRAAAQHPEVAFVGVAVQDPQMSDAWAFADEVGVSYTIAFDSEGTVDGEFRPLGLPASYIISGDGIIVERIFGKVTEEDLAAKFAEHFG